MRSRAPLRRRCAAASLGLLLMAPVSALGQPTGSAASPPPASAVERGGLELTGRLARPGTIDGAALRAMPPETVTITRDTPQGPRQAEFTGVKLWTLLSAAGPVHEAGPHSALRHAILAHGRDGYAVALAIGELDPDFEGKPVLVAYAQDGAPLPGLRLIVPGDRKAGRGVRDLVRIELR